MGLLSLTSTTCTLMVVLLLSGGFPLSVACITSLKNRKIIIKKKKESTKKKCKTGPNYKVKFEITPKLMQSTG